MEKSVITIQPKKDDVLSNWKENKINRKGETGGEYLNDVKRAVVQAHLYSFVAHVVAIKVPWAYNKFWIWDADSGELIFFSEENNNGRDGFEMPLLTAADKQGKVYRLSNPKAIASQACCCCGDLAKLSTFFNDRMTHLIHQETRGANFTIIDDISKKVIYEIEQPGSVCAWNCEDVVFPILDIHEKQVGRITKFWAGGEKGCLIPCNIEGTNASTFVIEFPSNASHLEKFALIGQALLLDYTYYQKEHKRYL